MGQIEDLRLFVSVVDSGGVSRAAEALNIAKSAVSRRLGQLEDRYGVRLIDRQPHVWAVTVAGQELYQRAAVMVADADELDVDFQHEGQALKGPLRISIAQEFGLAFMKPVLFQFIKAYPEIDLTVDFEDRTVDLERENYDMAVRVTAGYPGNLIGVPLGVSRHALYASLDYIAREGAPNRLEDLSRHPLLHFGSARRARWEFREHGKPRIVDFHPVLNSNNGPFLLGAARAGLGIARLPDFIVGDAVRAGDLTTVLPQCEIAEWGIHLVYSANRRINKRMRVLMEALRERCSDLENKR